MAQGTDQLKAITPQAAELIRSLNAPINMVTGTPEISFPVFDIQRGDIKIPITITYRASGIKVGETSGTLGLGWSLSAEPLLNRVIYGLADETTAGYKNYDPSFYTFTDIVLGSYLTRSRDGQPDEFYYSLLGASGSFMLKKPEAINDLKFLMFPKKNLEITPSSNFDTIKITDDNGITYSFDQLETSQSGGSFALNRTGWKPSVVKSNRTGQTIQFKYLAQMESYRTFGTTAFVESYPNTTNPLSCGGSSANQFSNDLLKLSPIVQYYSDPFGTFSYNVKRSQPGAVPGWPATNEWVTMSDQHLGYAPSQLTEVNRKQISEIIFDGGKVAFTYGEGAKCTDILVYSLIGNSYKIVKKISFRYGYENTFWGTNKKEFLLKKLIYYNSASSDSLVYGFNYDREGYGVLSNADVVKQVDYWGYYNGLPNTDLLPRQKIYKYFSQSGEASSQYDSLIIGNADRSANMNATLLTLTEIKYPTGGSSKYEYELNKYFYLGTVTDGGGLRVRKISTLSENGEVLTQKSYKYGEEESGYGYARRPIRLEDFSERISLRYIKTAYCSADNTCEKYLDIYNSFPRYDLQFRNSSAVMYKSVTEYSSTENNNIGKTEYTFNLPSDIFVFLNTPYRDPFYTQYGKLTEQKKYSVNRNSSGSLIYTLINKEVNHYGYDQAFDNYCASRIVKQVNRYLRSSQSTQCINPDLIYKVGQDVNVFDAQYYDYISYLVGVDRINYVGSDSLVKKEIYQYNPKNYQPSVVKGINSLGDSLITKIKYPCDYDGVLSGSVFQMRNENILTPEIEKSIFKKGENGQTERLVSSVFNSYETNVITPDKIYKIQEVFPLSNFVPSYSQGSAIVKDDRYVPRIHTDKVDAYGNIQQWHSDANFLNSYTWDYNNQYFSAEVKGAAWNDIAYTSFEADNNGGWNVPSTSRITTESVTGKQSFDLSYAGAGGITRTGLSSSSEYLVSYWTKNSTPYSIAGTYGATVKGMTSNGWTYYEHVVKGITAIVLTGGGLIDELRSFPANAEMVTYTYDPLIGMTSQCNSKNEIMYYVYDNFNRLKLIKDQYGKILKQYDYQYQVPITQ